MLANRLIWYTFLAIAIYLVLVNWRGANALLGSSFTGYARVVRSLQGRV